MKKTTAKDNMPGVRPPWPLILLCLLLSGACGLVYEIVWMKLLTLVIGNTVLAVTTALTAFMGGLALGSFLAGRLAGKIRNPLKAYGILEGGIGLYALLLPLLIAGTEPLFRHVYQNIETAFYVIGLLRFFVCGLLLLLPATLMGATLPVLSRYFVTGTNNLGRSVGLLYGVNTLGAAVGCNLAGFVLIPAFGVTGTTCGAAVLNLAIATAVLKFANRRISDRESSSPKIEDEKRRPKGKSKNQISDRVTPEIQPAAARAVMFGIGLAGLAGMIYQITWTRVLTLSIGTSVYAFSLIVTAFICGLALGSLAMTRFLDRFRNLLLGLGLMQGAVGIAALLIIPILGNLPVLLADYVFTPAHSFNYIHFVQFAVIFGLILIPTLIMGAAVPMAVKICSTDHRRAATFFGNVYAMNTLGAIVGSLMAGLLLVPWIGTQNTILVAVALNVVAAGVILRQIPRFNFQLRWTGALITAAIAVAVWLTIPRWDASILVSGPFLYAGKYRDISSKMGIGIKTVMRDKGRLLYLKEGLNALISVAKSPQGDVSLKINGKTDASAKGDDVATQLMLGHLPLLLHPGARDVLVIGLGSGMTTGAVQKHPVQTVDVVEIEQAVVEASRFFRPFTGDVLNDPRVNLIVADGRNHLSLTDRQYDVIISEPSNPWVAGMANLFTREFFESAQQRLRQGGLMCQWIHAYSLSSMDFKSIVRTFQNVFPHVSLWEATFSGDYLLIGSVRELRISPGNLADRLANERLRAHLQQMRATDTAALLSKLIMTETAIPEYAAGAPLHTDDNALLEYSAPRALLWRRSTDTLAALYTDRQNPLSVLRFRPSSPIPPAMADEIRNRFKARNDVLAGFTSYEAGAAQEAMVRLERALTTSPRDYDATGLLAKLYYRIGNRFRDEKRLVESAIAYEKSVATTDRYIRATRGALSDHFELALTYARASYYLGKLSLGAGRLERAATAFDQSLSAGLPYADAHNSRGIVHESKGEYEAALNQYRLAIKLDPKLASAYMNMGNILLRQKRYPDAIQCYRKVNQLNPNIALAHYNLGMAYYEQEKWAGAQKEWERALALKPELDQARHGLKAVRRKMERP